MKTPTKTGKKAASTVTLKEQAYQAIREQILKNHLPSSTPLTEEQLSAALNISRTPIRAALQKLTYEKLTIQDATGHIFVSTITRKDVENLTVLRARIEPLAIELASFPIDAEKIELLKKDCSVQSALVEEHPEDDYRYAILDTQFHTDIAALCDNSILADTFNYLAPTVIRVHILTGTLNPYKETAIEEHLELIHYLERGKKDFAMLALKEHVMQVGNRIMTSL